MNLRSALLSAVTEEDIREVIQSLINEAKSGNVQAARELLDRCLGRAPQAIQIDAQIEGQRERHEIDVNDPEEMIRMVDEMEAVGLELPGALSLHVEQLRKRQAR